MIEFISIAEAAQHFSVPAPTIYSYTKRGVIPSEKLFGRVLIKKSDLPEIESLIATRKKFSVQKKGGK